MNLLRWLRRVKTRTLMHPKRPWNPHVMFKPSMLRSQLFLLSPFRLFPLARAPRISRSLLLSSPKEEPRSNQRSRPPRLAPVFFLFRYCCCCVLVVVVIFFFFTYYFFFWTLGLVVMRFYRMNEISLFSFCTTHFLLLLSLLVRISCVKVII